MQGMCQHILVMNSLPFCCKFTSGVQKIQPGVGGALGRPKKEGKQNIVSPGVVATSLIPTLQRQGDLYQLEARLVYSASSRSDKTTH